MKYTLLYLTFVFVVFSAKAQTYNSIKPRTKSRIDSLYAKLQKQFGVVGFSLAIVDSGKIVYSNGYGFSDLDNKIKADDNTIYRIGSVSKSFTALSLLQLHEQGKLSIENPLKMYLPEFQIKDRFKDANQFKLSEILTHTSGLPSDMYNGFFAVNPPDVKWVAAQLQYAFPTSKPNYKHAYSNIGYGMLGAVIANVSGVSYNDYLKKNIFEPLKMNSSFVTGDSLLMKRYSKGYISKKVTFEPFIRDAAAGLIHSSVLDMSNYILMYLNKGKLLGNTIASENSVLNMEQNHLSHVELNKSENWGYGLYSKSYFNKKDSSYVLLVGHGGDTFCYHADMGFINEYGVGAVVLTNSQEGVRINNVGNLLEKYLKWEKNIDISAKQIDSTLAQNDEEKFNDSDVIGTYYMNEILVNVKSNKKFKAKQGPATIVFKVKKDNPKRYTVKAVLLGFIPIKVKNQEVEFAKVNGDMYLKFINPLKKNFTYMGIKTKEKDVPESWKNVLGKYHLKDNKFTCDKCPFGNFEGMKSELKMEGEHLVMTIKTKGQGVEKKYLFVVDDISSVTSGIGRGTGETITILPNRNLFYSGFEFVKD